jgi:virulence-associated protein VapD
MQLFEWLKEDSSLYVNWRKYSTCSQIILIVKSLHKVKWDLKRDSNLIQRINYYTVESKYDLSEYKHSIL